MKQCQPNRSASERRLQKLKLIMRQLEFPSLGISGASHLRSVACSSLGGGESEIGIHRISRQTTHRCPYAARLP